MQRITDEVVDDQMAEVLRRKSGAESLRIAAGLFDFAQRTVRASVREAHPEWDERQVRREVARRISHGATERVPPRPSIEGTVWE